MEMNTFSPSINVRRLLEDYDEPYMYSFDTICRGPIKLSFVHPVCELECCSSAGHIGIVYWVAWGVLSYCDNIGI